MENKKILIVDDEPDFVEVVKMRLSSEGYDIITAGDGKECLEKVKSDKPDAVLLDIMMPNFNGLETLEVIRKDDKKLPVFIVTAFPNEERMGKARELGISGFIVKGSDLTKEIDTIKEVLRLSQKSKNK